MVDVNSLQQLIGINQGITSLDTATGVTPRLRRQAQAGIFWRPEEVCVQPLCRGDLPATRSGTI